MVQAGLDSQQLGEVVGVTRSLSVGIRRAASSEDTDVSASARWLRELREQVVPFDVPWLKPPSPLTANAMGAGPVLLPFRVTQTAPKWPST